jgi:hypothetical protein
MKSDEKELEVYSLQEGRGEDGSDKAQIPSAGLPEHFQVLRGYLLLPSRGKWYKRK